MLQLITKNQDHVNSQHLPGSNSPASTGNEYAFSGTLVYNGVVYDNIHYRARGGVWRYAMGKNMWKIDFQNGHDFQAYYPDGTPYPTLWKKLDLGAMIQQGNIGDRGEQGLFETLGFQLFNLAGVPGSATIPATLRIIENASETGATQYTTDFQGLYLMTEEPDGRYLDAHGLPDGNFYKMEGGTGTSKNQGPTQPSDGSDLAAFIAALKANPTEQWLRDNVDLQSFYSFQAVTEFIHNWDIGFGKNYLYYHNPDTNKWSIIPWDLDLTWYVNYEPANGNITPFASAILSKPNLQIEYRNRVRELQDLLFTPEMVGKLADAYANLVNPPGTGPTLVQADAAMWNYNPIESSSSVNPSKAGVGLFWQNGSPTKDFPGMVARLKSFGTTRLTYLNTTVITAADNSAAPQRPTVNYTGAAGFPLNALSFSTGAFAPGTSGGAFAGMEWRIADVTNTSDRSPSIESNVLWDSGVLAAYSPTISIPSTIGLEPGHVYRVRVRMKDTNGRWSRWSDVSAGVSQFVASSPSNLVRDSLRITELNYNPSNAPVGSPYATQDFEYIELQNFGSQTINLAGVQFTNGIDYAFGNVNLAPGQVGVLVKRTAAFQSRYGNGILILGDYESTGQNFSNGGEHVELDDAFGGAIADFTYVDSWYPSTDGNGSTLEVINPAINPDLSIAANWRASATPNGTPGVGSTAALPAPTGAAATAVTSMQVTLGWIDTATTELGYRIYRRTSGGPMVQIADLPANAAGYVDNNSGAGLTPGVRYDYLIQAYNVSGFSDGAVVSVSTPTAAPFNFAAARSSSTVSLTWSVPAGAVTYNIYRGTTSGGQGATPLVANLAVPSFTDTGIPTTGNLYYVVKAVNAVGLESPASVEAVILLGPINQYSFEEVAGSTTVDSAGGNNGTLVGTPTPTRGPGRIGNGALSFTGDGLYNMTNESAVQLTSNLATSLGGTSTLDVWINTTQVGSNTHSQAPAITGVDQTGGTNDINWGSLNASGQIGIFVGDTSGIYSTNPVNDGQWHNVALTRDASTGVIQVYVDGVLNGSTTSSTGTKTSQFSLLGALSVVASNGTTFTGANFFNGSLDELRIYNRVLTAAEIAGLGIVPTTPTNYGATAAGASTAQLSWTNVSSFAQNVEVWRKTGIGGTYAQIAQLTGTATAFADSNLTAGVLYFYKIRATDVAGASSFTTELSVTPPRPTVAGRFVYYNGSAFDDENDANSIAVDRQVLLPGGTATAANYSSYSKGINGVMVDLTNLDTTLNANDFDFRIGNNSDPSTWQAAPEPQFVNTFTGAGTGGSTRVEIVWSDGAIANQWLQLTVKADGATQLAAPDVFYFGNAIGESGNSANDANVNSSDILGARGHASAGPVSITNAWDYNRDRVVDGLDVTIAQQHVTSGSAALLLITVPGAGGGSSANLESAAPETQVVSFAGITQSSSGNDLPAVLVTPAPAVNPLSTKPISHTLSSSASMTAIMTQPVPAKISQIRPAEQRNRDRSLALLDKALTEFDLLDLSTLVTSFSGKKRF